jgi:DNA-directed RNA polymerase subunit beta
MVMGLKTNYVSSQRLNKRPEVFSVAKKNQLTNAHEALELVNLPAHEPLQNSIVNKTQSSNYNKKEIVSLSSPNVPSLNILINSKAFNSVLREFFGTSPLSQFMDQINPLAEITHKRRLTSMGPGGVTRDNATMAIRGIHPTHYGRICPIETPEGKNTGLVNSMTAYAKVNNQGILESPFYKVYKGIVLKSTGIYYLSAEQEEKMTLAAADLFTSNIGFLAKSSIPVRINEDFLKIEREAVQYISISTLQMISIATSLIPFLEHDDANRALMGSNMQRQAVPLIRPERPIVGTGLEARAVSDSGHIIQSKYSGIVTYVSANKICIETIH